MLSPGRGVEVRKQLDAVTGGSVGKALRRSLAAERRVTVITTQRRGGGEARVAVK